MTVLPCHQCCQTSLISQGSNGGETQFHPFSPSYSPYAFHFLFFCFFLSSHKTWFSCVLLQCYLFVSHHLFFFLLPFSLSAQFSDLMLKAHFSHNLIRCGCFCHAVFFFFFIKLMFLDLSPIRSQSLLCFSQRVTLLRLH